MVDFTIPKKHEKLILEIAHLSSPVRLRFIEALKRSEPTVLIEDLAMQIELAMQGVEGNFDQFVSVIVAIYRSRNSLGYTIEGFADAICAKAKEFQGDYEIGGEEPEWPSFRDHLVTALGMDEPLGITIKALEIILAYDKVFLDARILSDIRPVYHLDPPKLPKAAVITHSLRMSYIEDESSQEITFALTCEELQQLSEQIDRALQKHGNLKDICTKSNLFCIESPKEGRDEEESNGK